LVLHPDKTRLFEFESHAGDQTRSACLGKPETFNFSRFTLICSKIRQSRSSQAKTRRDASDKLQEIKGSCGGACPADPRAGNG